MPDDSVASSTATIRTVTSLLREVAIIESACTDVSGSKKSKSKLDDFQQIKKDLHDILITTKEDIKIHKGAQERAGRNQEEIRMKKQIEKNIEEAKALQNRLEEAYNRDQQKFDKQKKDALQPEDLQDRKELVNLMKQDLEYTESLFKPTNSQESAGSTLARQARERRKNQREKGQISNEPIPLTEKQQTFIQQSIQRDAELDEKLELIRQGVVQIGMIGDDINQELDKQKYMLSEMETQMDKITDKLQSRNKQMKEILESSGGLQRWCPVVILLVVLLALLGYIYNLATKKK